MKKYSFYRIALAVVLTAGYGTSASAQFGNIMNRVKWSAQNKVEDAVVSAADKAGRDAVN